ncbi:hypothetical protein A2999_00140 [Candidatus Wolfebacteria bacterium RIFCSPLOWO2_01_FULL_38_11]|uniref:Uncharacterized protein n=2 Tax=Candidatus Wolfeibacteriota TaxID=1752735 RepID=A0A0G0G039_9BACT|nr:MAG: hypothetical protein US36_C0001G0026 [Candidatus Wolfebacteria bacterium GW2011_GWC1_37_10]OGM90362.1 MAG: hypothetical protein A2999_00140 [Candidatus Wolfebacteria bacterium RIFCSPLOWO2_01_FULL_38_11]
MILSSHIIVASAASAQFASRPADLSNSLIVFVVSFISHYALDFIPHWDYHLASIKKFPADNNSYEEKKFIISFRTISSDLFKNLIDGIIGLSGAVLILGFPTDFEKLFLIFIAVFASILPDALEVCYLIFKKFPLTLIHRFHHFTHTRKVFEGRPFFGIISQIISVAIISAVLFLLANWF